MTKIWTIAGVAGSFLLLAGCGSLANFNSLNREFKLTDGRSHFVDASARGVYVGTNAGVNDKAPGGTFLCTDPSPDAVTSYNATVAAALQTKAGTSGNINASDAASAAAIGVRTVGIEGLRDFSSELCLAEFSGRIDRWRADIDFNQQQRFMFGLLAIEELANSASPAAAGQKPNPGDGGSKSGDTPPPNPKDPKTAKSAASTLVAPGQQALVIPAAYELAASAAPASKSPAAKPPAKKTVKPKTQKSDQTGTPSSETATSPAAVVGSIAQELLSEDYTLSVCATYFADNIKDNPTFMAATGNPTTDLCRSIISQAQEYDDAARQVNVAYVQYCLAPTSFHANKEFCKSLGAQIDAEPTPGRLKTAETPVGRGGKLQQLYILKLDHVAPNELSTPPPPADSAPPVKQ